MTTRGSEFDLSLDGPRGSGAAVQFYGMFEGTASVANVSTQFGRELIRRLEDVDVALYSYNGPSYADPDLSRFGYVDHGAPLGIFYGFPRDITERFHRHRFRIGGFVCETERIEPGWVDTCNTLDLVIVPSTFCERSFRNSGVEAPIMVVPHGLEPEYHPQVAKRRTRPLVFYNTFTEASFQRKGIEELVGCFLEAFGSSGTEARLVLRTELSLALVDVRMRHDFGTGIRLMPAQSLDTTSFAAIYAAVHCTVHPSNAEGFGLIPLQSIACETPVIATAATGMSDYLDRTNSLELRTAGQVCRTVDDVEGQYPAIDEDHLVELLRDVHLNWEDHYEQVRKSAPDIRSRYAWPVVLEEFVTLVETIVRSDDHERIRSDLSARYGPG